MNDFAALRETDSGSLEWQRQEWQQRGGNLQRVESAIIMASASPPRGGTTLSETIKGL